MRRFVNYAKATLLLSGVALIGTSATTAVEAVTCWDIGHFCHVTLPNGEIAHHRYAS